MKKHIIDKYLIPFLGTFLGFAFIFFPGFTIMMSDQMPDTMNVGRKIEITHTGGLKETVSVVHQKVVDSNKYFSELYLSRDGCIILKMDARKYKTIMCGISSFKYLN